MNISDVQERIIASMSHQHCSSSSSSRAAVAAVADAAVAASKA